MNRLRLRYNFLLGLVLLGCLLHLATTECFNACSGHGKCTVYDMCICHRNWQSNDCSERVCQFGLAFVDSPKGDLDSSGTVDGPLETVGVNSFVYPYGTSEGYPDMRDSDEQPLTQSGHAYAECSNAGICDRSTGTCVCQHGFEGVACQRLTCPSFPGYAGSTCSGHGVCRTLSSIIKSRGRRGHAGDAYALWDRSISTACVCDSGFFGGDCHQRRCKKTVDPLYLDDFRLVSYGRYYLAFLFSVPNATISDGMGGQATFRVRVFDNMGEAWITERIAYPATCASLLSALEALPHRLVAPNSTQCSMSSHFALDPLARTPAWRVSSRSRYKAYFNGVPRVGPGARPFYRSVHPTFWAQNFKYSYAANNSADPTLTGHIFLLEFMGLVGNVRQPETVLWGDGRQPTMVANKGQLFTNVWTDGQRAEASDYFSRLCPRVTVRIDTTHVNYHFLTGFSLEEKLRLMQCLGDADLTSSNNLPIAGRPGYSWDTGSVAFPHLVRMVRVVTDVADSGFYVALYYDTTVTGLDGDSGVGTYADQTLLGTFRLLHPFESLDHSDAVQYYIFTTKGTMQVAGGKAEAAFDFGSREFFTTNQTHVIDTGVYWRVNETQTVELTGADVDEVQVIQTNTASAPEIQTITIAAGRSGSQQITGILVRTNDLASASCTVGSKCLAIETRLQGSISFRFDPTLCGSFGKTVSSDTNLCLQALAEIIPARRSDSSMCPTSADCVSSSAFNLGATAATAVADLATALCSIQAADDGSGSGRNFMVDSQGACGVTVIDLSQLMAPDVYQFAFEVTFVGDTLQGDVPVLTIAAASTPITYNCASPGCAPIIQGYKQEYSAEDGWTAVSNMNLPGASFLMIQRGNQPDGFYTLRYTCASKVTQVTIQTGRGTFKDAWNVTRSSPEHFYELVTITSGGGVQLRLGHVLYVDANVRGGTYHVVTKLDSSCTYAACLKGTVQPPIWVHMSTTGGLITADLGVFYSDPGKVDPLTDNYDFLKGGNNGNLKFADSRPFKNFGISHNCRVYSNKATTALSLYASSADVRSAILVVLQHFSPTGTSDLSVTRTVTALTGATPASSFGYTYSITFINSNGDIHPLVPKTSSIHTIDAINVWPTQPLHAPPTVTIATVQDGSMIYDGYFDLSQMFPHAYFGTPASTTVGYVRWNILPGDLQAALSSSQAFGAVRVTRSLYLPTGATRWTGGYLWTITFTERNGQLPKIGLVSSLVQVTTSAPGISITAATGTAASPLAADDPGVSVQGNQVGGTFGFSFTDSWGNSYISSNTHFNVIDPSTNLLLSAAAFRSAMMTMLGDRRQTSIKVTRSATVNAVLGYTYTIEFQGKELRGQQLNLYGSSVMLTQTAAPPSTVSIKVSEIIAGRNETVYNHQYAGEISCESSGIVPSIKQYANNTMLSACLAKGDFFLVLDPYTPSNNPPYLNMHRAVSIYAKSEWPDDFARYPRMSQAELKSLSTYKKFVIESDLASNWAHDVSGPATFRFYKFWPHEDTTYRVVTECGNRGTCNHFEGTCECFHGYNGDGCTVVESLAI